MYNVLDKKLLAPGLMRIDVSAPDVAAKARPGQFVIVRVVEHGERIPLTIGGADEKTGSITLLVQMVGLSHHPDGRNAGGRQVRVRDRPSGQSHSLWRRQARAVHRRRRGHSGALLRR